MLYFSQLILKTCCCCCCPEQGSSCIFIRNNTVLGGGIFQWKKEPEFFSFLCEPQMFPPALLASPLPSACASGAASSPGACEWWLSPGLSCPMCGGDTGRCPSGVWGKRVVGTATFLQVLDRWLLEKASLRWQVTLGGCHGLAFLLLLPSSVISHLHSPSCAAAGCQIWTDSGSCPSLLGDQELPLRVPWISKEMNQAL